MEQLYALHRSRVGLVCVCLLGLAFSLSALLAFSSTPLLQRSWLYGLLLSNLNMAQAPPTSLSFSDQPYRKSITEGNNLSSEASSTALPPEPLIPSSPPPAIILSASPPAISPPPLLTLNKLPPALGSSASQPPLSPPPLSTLKKLPPASRSNGTSPCDMSVGEWVRDGSHYPLYRPRSCPYVDEAFSCQENGRPDSDYLKWRWKPRGCDFPRFNAQNLLEKLRGKRLVFAGDSLMRNQWESMLCLLREGLVNKSRMLEMRGVRISKGRGDYVFKFLDYNTRVEFYRSHFLVAEGKQGKGRSGKPRLTLRIDTIDKTSKKWQHADVLIFTTGHWWTHGKTARGKDYFQEGEIVHESLPVMVAFKKAMKTWGSWIDKNVNPKLTKVFFCGYSPSHFDGGQWNSGGQCNSEREPIFNESLIPSYPEKMQVVEDIVQHMKNPVQILNVTRLSEFRKDAHPSIFGQVPQDNTRGRGHRQDCSHWCLPGLPDIWNELVYAFL